MKTIGKLSILALVMSTAVLFSGCSKEKKLEKRLVGSWSISSYEGDGTSDDDGTNKMATTSEVTISASNAGSYTFDDDGTGTYSLTYTMEMTESSSGTTTSIDVSTSGSFEWDNTDNTVTIQYDNGGQDEYTIEVNEKGKQVWTGTSNQSLTQGVDIGINVNNDVLDLDLDINMTLEKK